MSWGDIFDLFSSGMAGAETFMSGFAALLALLKKIQSTAPGASKKLLLLDTVSSI
jgi:hypothetical protein